MSSPDFPGPSWQDKPGSPDPFDDTGLYRDEPAGGRGGYGGAAGGAAGGARSGGYGYNGGGENGRGYNGAGRDGAPRNGSRRHGGNGRSDYGSYDRAGSGRPPRADAGYDRTAGYDAGNGRASHRDAAYNGNGYYGSNGNGSNGHGSNGHGSHGNGAGRNGYAERGSGRDEYGADQRAAYPGTEAAGRPGSDYPSRSRRAGTREYVNRSGGAAYRPGSDADGWEADDRPAGQGDPGSRTGLGRRVASYGRGRGPRGYADPEGRPPRTPAGPPRTLLQRLWQGSWWRHWTLKKAALLTGGLAVVLVLVLIAGFFYIYSSINVPTGVLDSTLAQSSTVYFANGKEVGCFCSVNRTNLTQAQVQKSTMVVAAAVAAEDRNFFHEGGVSMTGIIRAAKNDILGSGSLQGGSTITEELVKQYYNQADNGNLTYSEKVKEIVVAIKLAQRKSKLWVMTHYLNTIYFGAGALGAQAAAETYFGKPAWKLDAAQAAMLGAMIQSPSDYDPTHPNKAVPGLGSLYWRWKNEVIANMVKDGAISQSAADGLKFPKVHIRPPDTTWPGYRGYIMTLVQSELSGYYGISPSQIGSMGLQIYTTINERLMNRLYAAIRYEKRQMKAYGAALPWYVSIGAVLEVPRSGAIVAFYGGPNYEMQQKRCLRIHCQNPTVLAPAPVGSSFKPYVLATAVADGMDAHSSITNSHSPLCIPPADNTTQQQLELSKQTLAGCDTPAGYYAFNEPSENTPGVNLGVAQATAASNNASYMDLIHRTGVNSVIDMAQRLGVYSTTITGLKNLFWSCGGCKSSGQFPGAVNAALGEGSMTAVDQANTFATLVSGGISATPHVIDHVVRDGTRLPSKVLKQRVLTRAQAADTDWALSFDTNSAYHGTGVPNAVWDRPMIAKTGTLGSGSNSAAAWFLGAIPQYSMAVGLFTDHPATQYLDGLPTIGGWTGGYGGAWPATIWHEFMSSTFTSLKIKPLPTPHFGPPFTKWDQAPPIKKKCPVRFPGGPGNGGGGFGGNGGGGGGNGGGGNGGPGHGHNVWPFAGFPGKGKTKCQGNGGSPTPTPTPSPSSSFSPSPTPTPSPSFSISPSVSPSASPSLGRPARQAKTTASTRSAKSPRPGQQSAVNLPALVGVATLVSSELRKPTWVALTTGLV